jgi:hypothetical protein
MDALAAFDGAFQSPRLRLAESRAAVLEAGFELVLWSERELSARDRHRAYADRRLLEDCRRRYPNTMRRDLLVGGYTLVASRPADPLRNIA